MTRSWGKWVGCLRAWCGNDNIGGQVILTESRITLKFCYASGMSIERKEPTYVFTEKQVAEKSEIARRFIETRARLNVNVDKADNFLVKRFYNIDHNTYLEGALPAKYKELMGLVVSAGLRCDDCINYHIIQSYRLGVTRPEQEEALNVALVVGGSIVIPHLRRAYELLTELYG
jgi:AhpD family alkylhydroperoxidase